MFEVMAKDTEVSSKPKRRRFTAEYRLRIVKEAAACTQPREVGALLRREGLYSSHLTAWRKAAEQGELTALTPKKRGLKPTFDERNDQLIAMAREIAKLRARAERAERLVEIPKKSLLRWGRRPTTATRILDEDRERLCGGVLLPTSRENTSRIT